MKNTLFKLNILTQITLIFTLVHYSLAYYRDYVVL